MGQNKFEKLVSMYVFESDNLMKFRDQVNSLITEELENIKILPIHEKFVEKHKQKIFSLKDEILKNQDSDSILEASLLTLSAIDGLNEVMKDGRKLWIELGVENGFCDKDGRLK